MAKPPPPRNPPCRLELFHFHSCLPLGDVCPRYRAAGSTRGPRAHILIGWVPWSLSPARPRPCLGPRHGPGLAMAVPAATSLWGSSPLPLPLPKTQAWLPKTQAWLPKTRAWLLKTRTPNAPLILITLVLPHQTHLGTENALFYHTKRTDFI